MKFIVLEMLNMIIQQHPSAPKAAMDTHIRTAAAGSCSSPSVASFPGLAHSSLAVR